MPPHKPLGAWEAEKSLKFSCRSVAVRPSRTRAAQNRRAEGIARRPAASDLRGAGRSSTRWEGLPGAPAPPAVAARLGVPGEMGRVSLVRLQGLSRRGWTTVRPEAKTPQTGQDHAPHFAPRRAAHARTRASDRCLPRTRRSETAATALTPPRIDRGQKALVRQAKRAPDPTYRGVCSRLRRAAGFVVNLTFLLPLTKTAPPLKGAVSGSAGASPGAV